MNKQELLDELNEIMNAYSGEDSFENGVITGLATAIIKIGKLDEPEVLSSDWIKDNQLMGSSIHGAEYYVPANKLYGKIVPKQKEVKRAQIPEWIIEWYQGANNEFSTLEDVFSNLSHDTGYNIMDSDKFRSRIIKYGGFSKMYEALSHIYFGVYEIEEEEQKYYVLDSEDIPLLERANNQTCKTTTGLSIYEDGRDNSKFELTEQEIKDYDERYLAFKEPVEKVAE